MPNVTLLSFGAGQDSTAILLKVIHDPDFRARYVDGELLVVFADTGNEHPYTYTHIESMRELCAKHAIEFHTLTPDMGFHIGSWQDLISTQLRDPGEYQPTLVQVSKKTCTNQLKIGPIYKFLDTWLNEKFGFGFERDESGGCRKQSFEAFDAAGCKLSVLIGFAYGEESRAKKAMAIEAKEKAGNSWARTINRVFPLIDEQMDRASCIDYIESHLDYEVMPSNCMLCPYQSGAELLWLYRNHPDQWDLWCIIEQKKIDRCKPLEGTQEVHKQGDLKGQPKFDNKGRPVMFKNNGVYGKKLLPAKLADAQKKFGHMSDEELHAYKKTHGCSTAF